MIPKHKNTHSTNRSIVSGDASSTLISPLLASVISESSIAAKTRDRARNTNRCALILLPSHTMATSPLLLRAPRSLAIESAALAGLNFSRMYATIKRIIQVHTRIQGSKQLKIKLGHLHAALGAAAPVPGETHLSGVTPVRCCTWTGVTFT